MTLIGDKLRRAGVDSNKALLHAIAVESLRKFDLSPRRAIASFVSEVRDAGGIMAALHTREETEAVGIEYLQRVAADMRGDVLAKQIPVKAGAWGRLMAASDGQLRRAHGAVSAKAEGAGQLTSASDGLDEIARPNISSQEDAGRADNAREGQVRFAGDNSGAMANHDLPRMAVAFMPSSGSGSRGETTKSVSARADTSLPSPGAPRGSAALKAIAQAVPSIFDNCRLSDGTKIGDLRYSQLDGIFARSARDAAIVWVVRNAGIPADRNMRVREYLADKQIDLNKIDEAQSLIEHAAENDHVA